MAPFRLRWSEKSPKRTPDSSQKRLHKPFHPRQLCCGRAASIIDKDLLSLSRWGRCVCECVCVCVSCCLDSRSRFAQRLLNLSNANLNTKNKELTAVAGVELVIKKIHIFHGIFLFCYWYHNLHNIKFWKQIAPGNISVKKGQAEKRGTEELCDLFLVLSGHLNHRAQRNGVHFRRFGEKHYNRPHGGRI